MEKHINIQTNDNKNVSFVIPNGKRGREFQNQRLTASPETLKKLLKEFNLGYRTAADLIGIRAERMHSFTRPKGHHKHKPMAGVPYTGLMLALFYPERATNFRMIAEKYNIKYLDVVRQFMELEK